FYGMSTFEGPMLSVKSVNALSHYTDWGIGHVHGGALGWNGFMAFGMIYWLAPRLYQTKLHSQGLANLHFWIATLGILLYVISMYVAGITQGLMWRAITPNGQLVYPDFVETTKQLHVFYHIRLLGGLMYFTGILVGCYNVYRTWAARPAKYEVPVHEAPALRDLEYQPETAPKSQQEMVTDYAKDLEVWGSLWWHRVWERMPIYFTVLVTGSVVLASVLELVPTFVIRTNVPTIATVKPYTPLELAGRDVFVSEGCYNCHSQMIRPMVAETKRYGDFSRPGESVYDHPFQWGSRRIGPDLAREGGRQSNHWHMLHFRDPQQMNADSMMPNYAFLLARKLDFDSVPLRIAAMQALGIPYPQYEGDARGKSRDDAEKQAKEILASVVEQNQGQPFAAKFSPVYDDDGNPKIDEAGIPVVSMDKALEWDSRAVALVAYLQRLGTDLTAPAEPESTEQREPEPQEEIATEPAAAPKTASIEQPQSEASR
ncbi:MAG: cytochrome-c oxidase, cbb3-type subunit II, partial [Planctomycetales bacterium]|nr:cytochrome-c oxidase, cbb3-type subunit II [Planctomycetales bacterium]